MKKLRLLYLTALLFCMLILTAQAWEKTVPIGNQTATVTQDTVTYQDKIYRYIYTAAGRGYELTITYDDGVVYSWTMNDPGGGGSFGAGGYNDIAIEDADRTAKDYLAGQQLVSVIEQTNENLKSGGSRGNNFFGILLIAAGVFYAAFPRKAFAITTAWQYKNLEPSDARLTINCIVGILLTFVGVLMLLA